MKKHLLLSSLLVALFIPNLSHACSCSGSSIEELLDNADHIFVAYITSAKIDEDKRAITFKYDAKDVLKGDASQFPELKTGIDSCQSTLMVTGEYLVLLNKGPYVSPCGGTRELSSRFHNSKEDEQAYLSILRSYINDHSPIKLGEGDTRYMNYRIKECKEDTHPLNIQFPLNITEPL